MLNGQRSSVIVRCSAPCTKSSVGLVPVAGAASVCADWLIWTSTDTDPTRLSLSPRRTSEAYFVPRRLARRAFPRVGISGPISVETRVRYSFQHTSLGPLLAKNRVLLRGLCNRLRRYVALSLACGNEPGPQVGSARFGRYAARTASAVSTRCPQGRSGNCRLLSDPAADARPPHGGQAFEVDREIFPRSAPAVRIGVNRLNVCASGRR